MINLVFGKSRGMFFWRVSPSIGAFGLQKQKVCFSGGFRPQWEHCVFRKTFFKGFIPHLELLVLMDMSKFRLFIKLRMFWISKCIFDIIHADSALFFIEEIKEHVKTIEKTYTYIRKLPEKKNYTRNRKEIPLL